MKGAAQLHYLEVVTPDVDTVCEAYSHNFNLAFSRPIAELGGARTAPLSSGGTMGIRAPMHESEQATTRPYYLVNDIEKAVKDAESDGAVIAVPPMDIPNHGQCAVIMFGEVQSGFWQI